MISGAISDTLTIHRLDPFFQKGTKKLLPQSMGIHIQAFARKSPKAKHAMAWHERYSFIG